MNCNTYFDKKIEIKEAICLMETKINELVEMYNRIDADHAIIAEKVKELEKLIDYLLGAGLAEEVKKKLEEWLADGTLADIIGDTLDKWTGRLDDIENNKIPTITEQLDSIVHKTYEINICNPPRETGLKPLTVNGNIAENTNRLQAIFDYVLDHQLHYKEPLMSIYTGYTYKIKFPTGLFVFDSEINVKGSYVILEGNRTIIQTTHTGKTFMLNGDMGWNFEIKGFTFDRVQDGIYANYSNIEMGNINIENCWFIDVKNEAIHLEKQSQITTINRCKFHHCKYVLYTKYADRVYFERNWISEKPRETNKDGSIINHSIMKSKYNLFVPYNPVSGVTESAYFNNYNSLTSDSDHFGSEEGAKCVVNNFSKGKITPTNNYKVVEIVNSDNLYSNIDYTVIRLFEVPNKIKISNNCGLVDSTKLIEFGNGVDKSVATSWLNKTWFKLILSDNAGNTFNDNVRNKIPVELTPFFTDTLANIRDSKPLTIEKTNENTWVIKNVDIKTVLQFSTTGYVNTSASWEYISNIMGYISFKVVYKGNAITLIPISNIVLNGTGGFAENTPITLELKVNNLAEIPNFNTSITVDLTIKVLNIDTCTLKIKDVCDGILF